MNSSPTLTKTAPQLLLEFHGQFPAPMPDQLQHANSPLLAQYLNSWARTSGEIHHQEVGDFEHFVENMARFDAASRAFGYPHTRIRHIAGKPPCTGTGWQLDPAKEQKLNELVPGWREGRGNRGGHRR
jgi:hypothetical protein